MSKSLTSCVSCWIGTRKGEFHVGIVGRERHESTRPRVEPGVVAGGQDFAEHAARAAGGEVPVSREALAEDERDLGHLAVEREAAFAKLSVAFLALLALRAAGL